MQLDLDLNFPIHDCASAELMVVKAVCLCNAGAIDARQKNMIEQRALHFLAWHEMLQAVRSAWLAPRKAA